MGDGVIKYMNKLINSIKKVKIPRDFLLVFIFDILAKILMVVITILLIRMMPPSEYAFIVIFTAISSFIYGIIGEGISLSFIRYSTEQLSRTGKNTVGLHAISSIVIFFLTILFLIFIPFISNIFNTTTQIVFIASIYALILSVNNMNQAYFQSREMYVRAGIINNLKNVFLFILLIYLVFSFNEVTAVPIFIAYIICGSIAFILGTIKVYKGIKIRTIFSDSMNFKVMLRESVGIIIYLILLSIINQVDVIMISNLMSIEDVALYGIAFRYYALLLTLLPAIKAVLRVRTSKAEYIDDVYQRQKITINWIKSTWKFVIPCVLVVVFLSDLIMPILNGKQYDVAIGTFKILAIGVGISYIFASNISIMMSAKKYKELCSIALIALIINVLLNFVLIPKMGINGSAIATVLSHLIINVSATYFILFKKEKNK